MLHLVFDQAVPLWDHPHGNRRYVDIDTLLMYWRLSRHSYYLPVRPADEGPLLFEERPGGRTIAIERREITWEDIRDGERFVCQKGRLTVLSVKDLAAFACSVQAALCEKVARNCLPAVQADERVLLLTSRLVGTDESTFLWAPLDMPVPERLQHLYLIAQGRLLEFGADAKTLMRAPRVLPESSALGWSRIPLRERR